MSDSIKQLEDIMVRIETDIASIDSFMRNPPGYRPAVMKDFYNRTIQSLLQNLGKVKAYRPSNQDIPANRKSENRILERIEAIFEAYSIIQIIGRTRTINMTEFDASRTEGLFECAMDLWMLAGRYKEAYHQIQVKKKDTVRIKRNYRSDTQVFR
jgi:hypothetical protein